MTVKEAKSGNLIEIMCCGSYDSDSSYYLITDYQDVEGKVRAYRDLGGGIVYLHPDNNCRVINQKELI